MNDALRQPLQPSGLHQLPNVDQHGSGKAVDQHVRIMPQADAAVVPSQYQDVVSGSVDNGKTHICQPGGSGGGGGMSANSGNWSKWSTPYIQAHKLQIDRERRCSPECLLGYR